MPILNKYTDVLADHLERAVSKSEPTHLYDPIKYILSLGGKRIRPALTLMICDLFDKPYRDAIPAALAVEMFHNFSLMHDDIMDDAPLRRGNVTVHEKWDVNTAILSGDAMLILAYRFFESYEPTIFKELAELFSETALEVCEGQQSDMDFEVRENVDISEYLKMIEQKTAVLLGAAMKMGAIVANVTPKEKDIVYNFGLYLGIAFQLQDDYLDVYGNPETFGKQIGGDIMANKKTFLYLKAEKEGNVQNAEELKHLFSINPTNAEEKIKRVQQLYASAGADESTRLEIEKYSNMAYEVLNELSIPKDKKELLRNFGKRLMLREV